MLPLISVIIPVYNGAAFLPACLDALLAQTYPEYEIILMNDGSTDHTPEICCAYAQKDSRIHYHKQENHGLAATRNLGIRASKGSYISFVDADDWVEPTYLAYLLTLLQTAHCAVSACNHWIDRGSKSQPRFAVSDSQISLTPQEAFFNLLYDRSPDVSAWGKLYQREVLDGIQYPESRLFEDTYRIAEVLLAAGSLVYGGKPQYHYRIQTDSLSRGRFSQSKLDYLSAVDHMTGIIAAHSKGLENAIARRKMHALLSTRRYMIGCNGAETEIRDELDRQIRAGAAEVLWDAQAPLRDKVGILSVKMGTGVYDAFWKIYERIRSV